MTRYRLDLGYDGAAFHGWAAQTGLRTVQGELETWIGRGLTLFYFMFFITMPMWTKIDKTKPVPDRVTMHD